MDRNSRILISGAGVAGLTAAIWLARAGFRPVIVEKAPSIRADGYILTLSHHCYHLTEEMGILDDLWAHNNRVRSSSYHDGSGRAILSLDYERLFEEGRALQIMRDDLESILYARAKDCAEFRFADSVSGIVQDGDQAQVTFESGEEQAFDVVIGADGLHSGVRAHAFRTDQVRRHRLGLHSAAFRCDNVLGLEHKYEAYLDRHRHTIVYTTRTNELATIFIWENAEPQVPSSNAERLAYLRATYRGADPRALKLIETRSPEDRMYMDLLMQIEIPTWRAGRVVLVGDAAHCLTQLSGQGASLSIAGASTLARKLADEPFETAVRNYEAEIRPIAAELQPATRNAAKWYVPKGLGFHLVRDWSMRLLPTELWVRYFKSKYSDG